MGNSPKAFVLWLKGRKIKMVGELWLDLLSCLLHGLSQSLPQVYQGLFLYLTRNAGIREVKYPAQGLIDGRFDLE